MTNQDDIHKRHSKVVESNPARQEQKIKLMRMCLADARLSLNRREYAEVLLILNQDIMEYLISEIKEEYEKA